MVETQIDQVAAPAVTRIARGTAEFRRVTLSLFLAGLATFTLLYCVQPLLPVFSVLFGVPAASSSLVLSLSTGALAVSIMLVGVLSARFGRKRVIGISLVLSASCNLAAALAPDWTSLLVLRTLEGFCLGGTPAVAMAYIAEEIAPGGLAGVMGLYIGGNAIGGMSGRLLSGVLAEWLGWRYAMGAIGLLSLAAAIGFIVMLPASRHFQPQYDLRPRFHHGVWARQLRDPRLRGYFTIGFLVMGAFVTIYNYTGYRLGGAPYRLGESAQGAIFLVYVLGTLASTWSGSLGDRYGRARILNLAVVVALVGVALMMLAPLVAIVCGVALVTMGFFAAHSAASAAVGKLAGTHKGHATALYLLFYYLGSSVVGSLGGLFWSRWAWPGVAAFATCALLGTLALGIRLARGAPVSTVTDTGR